MISSAIQNKDTSMRERVDSENDVITTNEMVPTATSSRMVEPLIEMPIEIMNAEDDRDDLLRSSRLNLRQCAITNMTINIYNK